MRDHIPPEQYLELDRKAEFKSEYWTGELEPVHPLAWVHSVIVANLSRLLQDRSNAVCASGMRVAAGACVLTPDILVLCGAPEFADEGPCALSNPTVVCEVSTPETAVADGDRKFSAYGSIASVREYVWVTADRIDVRVFTRQPDGTWLMQLKDDLTSFVTLASIDGQLPLSDIYKDVEFSDANVGVGYMRPMQF